MNKIAEQNLLSKARKDLYKMLAGLFGTLVFIVTYGSARGSADIELFTELALIAFFGATLLIFQHWTFKKNIERLSL